MEVIHYQLFERVKINYKPYGAISISDLQLLAQKVADIICNCYPPNDIEPGVISACIIW